jgi:ribosomal protein S18 acetylase RimI-like enzyme
MKSELALTIESLDLKDINQVADIHMKAFKDSALTRLGYRPVIAYYKYLLSFRNDNYNIGCFDKDKKLLGFSFSGRYSGSLTGFLIVHRSYLIIWFLLHPWKIFNPLIYDRIRMALSILTRSYRASIIDQDLKVKSFGILSIAVDPEKQGLGIGKKIMKAIEGNAHSQDFQQLHLTVHPNNTKAVSFYEENGWKRCPTFQGIWTGYMVKPLLPKE